MFTNKLYSIAKTLWNINELIIYLISTYLYIMVLKKNLLLQQIYE